MSDASVDKWRQEGHLYVWKYKENVRNYSGWNLTADNVCCRSFADLIERMLSARWSSQKVLNVSPPSMNVLRVPNNHGGKARWESAQSFVLKHPKDKVPEDFFSLEEDGNAVNLSVGKQKLEMLHKGILGIPEGKGDYAIGSKSSREPHLWFWWS